MATITVVADTKQAKKNINELAASFKNLDKATSESIGKIASSIAKLNAVVRSPNRELKALASGFVESGTAARSASKDLLAWVTSATAATKMADKFGAGFKNMIASEAQGAGYDILISKVHELIAVEGKYQAMSKKGYVELERMLIEASVATSKLSAETKTWAINSANISRSEKERLLISQGLASEYNKQGTAVKKLNTQLAISTKRIRELNTDSKLLTSSYESWGITLKSVSSAYGKLSTEQAKLRADALKMMGAYEKWRKELNTVASSYGKIGIEQKKISADAVKMIFAYGKWEKEVKATSKAIKEANNWLKKCTLTQQQALAIQKKITAETNKTAVATRKNATFMRDLSRGAAAGLGQSWMAFVGNFATIAAGYATLTTVVKEFNNAVDFEYITAYTKAIDGSGDSAEIAAEKLGKMRKELLEIRGVTQTPAELAAGLKEFQKAGQDTNKVLESGVLQTVGRFSTIAEVDMADAVALLSTQMKAFGIEAGGMETMLNQMTTAVYKAPIGFNDLTGSLKYTASIAKTLNVDFGETLALVSRLGDVGIKASMAGSTIRTGLTRMVATTGTAAEMFDKLGISISDAYEDGALSIPKALALIQKAKDQLSPEDFAKFAKEVFGLRAQTLSAITDAETYAQRLKDVKNGVIGVNEVYKDVSDTFKILSGEMAAAFSAGFIEEFSNNLSDLNTLLIKILPHADDLGTSFAYLITLPWQIFDSVGTAFGSILGAIASVIDGTQTWKEALLNLKDIFLDLLSKSPFGKFSLFLIEEFETISVAIIELEGLFKELWVFLKTGAELAATHIENAFKMMFNAIKIMWADLLSLLADGLENLGKLKMPDFVQEKLGINFEFSLLDDQADSIRSKAKEIYDNNLEDRKNYEAEIKAIKEKGVEDIAAIQAETDKKISENTVKNLVVLEASSKKAFEGIEESADEAGKSYVNLGNKSDEVKDKQKELEAQAKALAKANKSMADALEKEWKRANEELVKYSTSLEKHKETLDSIEYEAQIANLKGLDKLYAEITKKVEDYRKEKIKEIGDVEEATEMSKEYEQALLDAAVASGEFTKAQIESAKASEDFVAGFKAGIVDMQDDLLTLGQIGYDVAYELRDALGSSFTAMLKGEWDSIPDIWMGVWDKVLELTGDYIADQLFNLGKNAISSLFSGMTSGSSSGNSGGLLSGITSAIGSAFSGDGVMGSIGKFFSGGSGSDCINICGGSAGSSFGKSIGDGVGDALSGLTSSMISQINSELDVAMMDDELFGFGSGIGGSVYDAVSSELDSAFANNPDLFGFEDVGTSWWGDMSNSAKTWWADMKQGAADFVGGAENLSTIVSGAGAVAGAYGLYSGISDMSQGNYVSGGIKTGASAYSLYNNDLVQKGAKAAYDMWSGSKAASDAANVGANAALDAAKSGTSNMGAIGTTASYAAAAYGAYQAYGQFSEGKTGQGIASTAGAGAALYGAMYSNPYTAAIGTALIAISKMSESWSGDPLAYSQFQTSTGQDYTAIQHEEGQGAQFDLQMSLGQQARDFANSTADMSLGIQNYMNGLDILVTQFDDGMGRFYASVADGQWEVEAFADYMSINFGNALDVTAQQAEQMSILAQEAASGSNASLQSLIDQFMNLGLTADNAAASAMALVASQSELGANSLSTAAAIGVSTGAMNTMAASANMTTSASSTLSAQMNSLNSILGNTSGSAKNSSRQLGDFAGSISRVGDTSIGASGSMQNFGSSIRDIQPVSTSTSSELHNFSGAITSTGQAAANAASIAINAAGEAQNAANTANGIIASIQANAAKASNTGVMGSFETGTDYVPQTGPYMLHQGEQVIPADEQSANVGSVNLRVFIGTKEIKDDIRVVADELIVERNDSGIDPSDRALF